MNTEMLNLLSDKVSAGLQRKAIVSVSKYAETYRIMGQPYPGPWTLTYHPWLKEILDCWSDITVGQKAAQMGFTEAALNKCFYKMDIEGVSCLYVLPASTPDANDFSARAFDPAVESSAHLSRLFTDVKNLGHKRAGNANLYIRGSRSRSQLKSIPVGFIVLDEVDEMLQENIPLAFERMSGQREKKAFLISTPTIANRGINSYYKTSSMEEYHFRCPHCSKFVRLDYPESLVITGKDFLDANTLNSYYICTECKNKLDHNQKVYWLKDGVWVPKKQDNEIRGFTISQMYSMTITPGQLAVQHYKSQLDPAEEQEFNNSKLGRVHAVKGAKVTEPQIISCYGTYVKAEQASSNNLITMGVDVGKYLHYEIDQWFVNEDVQTGDVNLAAIPRVLTEGTVVDFEELDELIMRFSIRSIVIDIQPERRKALEFAKRWQPRVKCCYYAENIKGKDIKEYEEESYIISVDRSSWLDLSLGRFKNRRIVLPKDVSLDYREQIMAQVKVYTKNADGNVVSHFETGNEADHFGHARNYAEIALRIGVSLARNQSIRAI